MKLEGKNMIATFQNVVEWNIWHVHLQLHNLYIEIVKDKIRENIGQEKTLA